MHDSVATMLGSSVHALLGRNFATFVPAHQQEAFRQSWRDILTGRSTSVHVVATHETGYLVPLELALHGEADGTSTYYVLEVRDLSHRGNLEEELLALKDSYLLLSESTSDAVLQIDSDFRIVFANSAVGRIFGYAREQFVDKNLRVLFADSEYERCRGTLESYFGDGDSHAEEAESLSKIELLAQKQNGDMIPVEVSLGSTRGAGHGRILTCTIRDLTLRKKADRRMRYLTYHDKLTTLGNRDRFAESLGHVLADVKGAGNHHAALLYLDLDGFKKINDSLGHEIGDAVLKECAKRLGNSLRDGDEVCRFDFEDVFRVGGDEFAILLPYITRPADAAIVARRVIDNLSQPYPLEGCDAIPSIRVGVSIGIALIPRDGSDRTTILRKADAAMYRAKERGNSFAFFAEEMNNVAMERLMTEQGIRNALAKNELEVYYQPMVNTGGELVCVEALIRWNHPDRGLILPDKFISVAEDIDLMRPLGAWVMSTACMHLSELKAMGFPDLSVSVNVSPSQLERDDIAVSASKLLARFGLDPSDLRLEVTESVLMANPERSRVQIERIRNLNEGLRIAIDDFGTGYSSLAYLTQYAVDDLKIDRSLVSCIDSDHHARVAKAIIDLGNSLGIGVVAEGVETAQQFETLSRCECPLFQGFYFQEPVSFSDLRVMMKSWRHAARPIRTPAP